MLNNAVLLLWQPSCHDLPRKIIAFLHLLNLKTSSLRLAKNVLLFPDVCCLLEQTNTSYYLLLQHLNLSPVYKEFELKKHYSLLSRYFSTQKPGFSDCKRHRSKSSTPTFLHLIITSNNHVPHCSTVHFAPLHLQFFAKIDFISTLTSAADFNRSQRSGVSNWRMRLEASSECSSVFFRRFDIQK